MSALPSFAPSRFLFVPAAVVALTAMAGAMPARAASTSGEAISSAAETEPQTESGVTQSAAHHVGTAAIGRTTSRDAAIVLTHLRQQLARVTGVAEKRQADIETLALALDAARTRKIAPEKMTALAEALATALAQGTFEEVTIERLAEDLYAALNNKALTGEQAALVAVDVASVLQDAGAPEPHAALVLIALQGVCPRAVVPPPAATNATSASTPQGQAAAKRALLVLSRGSSE